MIYDLDYLETYATVIKYIIYMYNIFNFQFLLSFTATNILFVPMSETITGKIGLTDVFY